MSRVSLKAKTRDSSNKSPEARRLRSQGRVPAVMYGHNESHSISLDELEIAAVIRKGATIVDLDVEGLGQKITLLKSHDTHPVRGDLVHVDFQEVRMDETVKSHVPLNLTGESPGVKLGGVLTQATHEVHIECAAASIPDAIDVDISSVDAGDTITLADVAVPSGVTFLDDPGMNILSCNVPRKARSAAAGADESATGDSEGSSDNADGES